MITDKYLCHNHLNKLFIQMYPKVLIGNVYRLTIYNVVTKSTMGERVGKKANRSERGVRDRRAE